MHRQQPYQPNASIPYSKWSQHRAENGLIYLSHPHTGEVKWLWSRHRDPATSNDYLVNTITGERQWVTSRNAHLCPVDQRARVASRPNANTNGATGTYTAHTKPATVAPTTHASKTAESPAVSHSNRVSGGASSANTTKSDTYVPVTRPTNPFAEMPKAPQKVATNLQQQKPRPAAPAYKEIPAPKSLGLTADEVLMWVPETGRRYVFNKKTRTSRWLPQGQADTIPAETGKGLFRRKTPKSGAPLDDNGQQSTGDTHQLPERTKTVEADSGVVPEQFGSKPQTGASNSTSAVPNTPARPASQRTRWQNTPQNSSRVTSGNSSTMGHDTIPSMERRKGQTRPIRQSTASSAATPVYTADEAAKVIQRYLSAHAVRKADVAGKIMALSSILAEIRQLTESGKYDMKYLRDLANRRPSKEEAVDGAQRLLELGEYLTQKMLKVDLVESAGSQIVRTKRKECVKIILAITDESDDLRKRLRER